MLPRCPSCGNELPIDAKFCDSCGAPLHKTIPAQDGAPTRKIVTVLFSDLTGSTALGERMDPESVRAIMTPVYASMRNEVEAKGGVVTKFVGDGVMAAFGVPEVREDDAMRAVDAAVAMQQAIARLSLDLPVVLSLKVGVNTGEVVVGSGDEDIVGDCVNVASRLEGAAAPGEVLVGEETWRLTRSSATYEPVAPLALKGKAQPVPAYRLVSLERTQEAGTAAFVGRAGELGVLQGLFEEAVTANAARLATIVGSPGLGKTRLARELGASLVDRATVVETRCDAAGTATFAPIADALRSVAGIPETASPDEVRMHIAGLISEENEDRERVATRVAAILGAGDAGSTEETFWAIRRLVETAAVVRPIVLILDDLQWAEPLLLDLVEHLVEWSRSSPVLIVVTGRPELREMRPRMTERAISLEGLDGHATEALACSLLGTDRVPRELLARLPSSTEGNPLFVREFVRMLVDDGVLRRSGEAWISTIDVDAIQVPPTIHSLLAARVDRLTPHERTVLELASVIGKEFYMGAIAEIAPAAVKVDLSAHLESLRRKELVEPAGTYWIDEPVFRFHHALIQDAAYRRLLKESRAELHERVADWLEAKTGGVIGEHDELVGYHLEQAYQCRRQLGLDDDHVAEIGRRAGLLLGSAARGALDLDDLPSAAALSGRALACLDASEEARAEILLTGCEALLATGDVVRAAEAVAELERGAATSARLKAWATCFSCELTNMTDPSRLRETEELVAEAAAELIALGDPGGAAKAFTVQAISLAGLGRVAACESALDRALNAARDADDRRRVTAVLAFAPVAALWGPSPVSRAGGRCLDIVRLLRITTGSPAVEATSERCQAVLESFRGRAPAARRMLERVRAKVEELGLRQGLLETELFYGIVELVARDPSAAELHLRAARDGFHAMGNDLSTARAAALLGRALLAMEDEDAAAIYVTESERLGGDDLKNAIAWRAVRAELLARKGELDEARRLAEEAVEFASRTDALIDHADACMALAEVCHRAGDVAGARRARDAAIALYERKGATAYIEATRPLATVEPEAVEAKPAPGSLTNRCVRISQHVATRYVSSPDTVIEEWAEDGVIDDRRPLVKHVYRGRTEVSRLWSAVRQNNLATVRFDPVAIRGEDLMLARMSYDGPDVGSSAFGTPILALIESSPASELTEAVLFAPEAMDEALAELDARFAAMADEVHNACSRATQRGLECLLAGDIKGAAELLSDDYVWTDKRPGMGVELDKAGTLENNRLIHSLGEIHAESTPIATRGERLALVTEKMVGGDANPWEAEILFVSELNEDGLQCSGTVYEPTDFVRALRDLDERFVQAEGADAAEIVALISRFCEAVSTFEKNGARATFADDLVQIDHRPASLSEIRGGDAMATALFTRKELRSVTSFFSRYLALTPSLVVGEFTSLGRTHDDEEIEQRFNAVIGMRDGLLSRIERFPLEARDEALARFDELGRLDERSDRGIENRCSRVSQRFGEFLVTRDFEAMASILAPNIDWDDRRAGLSMRQTGRDAVLSDLRIAAALQIAETEVAVIATRAERLALMRVTLRGPEDDSTYENSFLALNELDDDGRLVRAIEYDESDLDSALVELEERFIAGEGAAVAEPVRVISRITASISNHNDDYHALISPDFVQLDHRPASLEPMQGRAAFVRTTRAIQDLVPDLGLFVCSYRALRADACVASVLTSGTTADGNPMEQAWHGVVLIRDGVATRLERFAPEDLDAALARFDELSRPVDNRCVSVVRVYADAMVRRDWETLDAMTADDAVGEDGRPMFASRLEGKEAVLDATRGVLVDDIRIDVVATRGERLALVRELFMATVGEVEVYFIWEIDEAERVRSTRVFDLDDLRGALLELDRRFAVGEGAPCGAIVRVVSGILRSISDGDDVYHDLIAEDHVHIDHRPASLGDQLGRNAFVASTKAMQLLAPGLQIFAQRFAALTPMGCVVPLMLTGATADGVEIEQSWIAVAVIRNGAMVHSERFASEDLSSALARLDELTAASAAWYFESSCVRTWVAACAAIEHADWDELEALLRDDVVSETRRAGLGHVTAGRERFIEDLQAAREVGVTRLTLTPLAVRGERLALGRVVASGDRPDLYAVEMLNVLEVDDEGRLAREALFDAEDLDAALVELDDRFIAGEGAELAETYEDVRRFVNAYNTRDWDTCAEIFRDDIVYIDHRPASHGEVRGAESVVEISRAFSELATVRIRVERYLRVDDRGVLMRMIDAGSTADGGAFEIPSLVLVVRTPDRRVARIERFPDDAPDEALARYEALASVPVLLENAATASARRGVELMLSGDWETHATLFAPEYVFEDRRAGLGSTLTYDANVGQVRELAPHGLSRVSMDVIAVRGERLMLMRSVIGSAGFEVEALILQDVDPERGLMRDIFFDPDDLPAAFRELDERFIAGEGAANAERLSLFTRMAAAISAHDWPLYRTLLNDDFRFVDHRSVSLGEITDPDAMIAAHRTLIEVVPDGFLAIAQYIAMDVDRVLARVLIAGHSVDGGAVDLSLLATVRLRDGLISRLDFFPLEAIDEARTRFDELDEAVASDEEDPHVRRSRVHGEHIVRRDWASYRASYVPDCHWEDRRKGMGSVIVGIDSRVENAKVLADLGLTKIRAELIATRGPGLALKEEAYFAGGVADEGAVILVVEKLDDQGRLIYDVGFDLEAIDEAFAELDRRFAAEGPSSWRVVVAAIDALNARDWDACTACFADDAVYDDHRPASLGRTIGGRAFVALLKSLVEVVPDLSSRIVSVDDYRDDAFLMQIRPTGTNDTGGEIEIASWAVVQVIDGRITRMEEFPLDAREEARARFDELASPSTGLQNSCTRFLGRFFAERNAGDAEAGIDMLADDVWWEDRRSGMGWSLEGREAVGESLRFVEGRGWNFEVLATRGERLGLFKTWIATDGYEVETLAVLEIDAEDREKATVVFDVGDLDAAYAELDARFVRGEGAPHADLVSVAVAWARAYNARDWSAARRGLADDFTAIDHRPASFGRIDGGDAMIVYFKKLIELMPDARWDWSDFHLITASFAVSRVVISGTSVDGAKIEFPSIYLSRIEHGRAVYNETFPISEMDVALRRVAELEQEREGPDGFRSASRLDNTCVRAIMRYTEAFNRSDWDLVRTIFADDAILVDARAGLKRTAVSSDDIVRWIRTLQDVGFDRSDMAPLAIRGDDLAFVRLLRWTTTGFVVEQIVVAEATDEGRLCRVAAYDGGDLDQAYADLDERYANVRPSWGPVARAVNAFNERDWKAWVAAATPDVVYVDHRPAGAGTIEGAEAGTLMDRVLVDVVPDFKIRIESIEAIGDRGCVAVGRSTGTNAAGGPIEIASHAVVVVRDGLIARLEEFPILERDTALARYEELTTVPSLSAEQRHRRFNETLWRYTVARDWDSYRALFDPDCHWEDRRSGLRSELVGIEARVANARNIAELRGDRIRDSNFDVEVIATRGPRFALVARHIAADGYRIDFLVVEELDDDGRLVRDVAFELDDREAAFVELDEWFTAGFEELTSESDASEQLENASVRVAKRYAAAFNAKDWSAVGALCADDVRYTDRRSGLSRSLEGRAGLIESFRTLTDVATWRLRFEPLAVRGETLCLLTASRSTPDGWAVEHLLLLEIDDGGHIVRHVNFDPEDLDTAYGDLDRCFLTRGIAAYSAGDVRKLASMATPDIVMVDHAMVGLGEIENGRRWAESQRVMRDLVTDFRARIIEEVAAANGVFLVLVEILATNAEGGELVDHTYFLLRVRDGLFDLGETFTETQRDAALARFEELAADSSDG
jgi:class 3 adenylate cyclase/ketosteroid isomerase-like protein/tetratricopeptide (TPR) repeat protein